MSQTDSFAERIRARYPEGLTGLFAIGATRRTYILDTQRGGAAGQAGAIDDFADMGAYLLTRYLRFCGDFFALGGQHMVIGALSYRSFFERGEKYAARVVPEVLRLIGETATAFYRDNGIDPYFIGLEILESPAASPSMRGLAEQFRAFAAGWDYQPHHRTIFWEIATIPLLSLWQVIARLSDGERADFTAHLDGLPDFPAIQGALYDRFTRAILGVPLPMPHVYLGTNMAGDLKFRSPLMLALSGGEYLRAYYTPYPTLFMPRETLQHILDDLAFSDRLAVPEDYDYRDRYTPELIEAEYARIVALAADPGSVIGLTRRT